MLINGESVPYIGISGTAVTNEIAKQQSMPTGMYVVEVDVDSPAMEAGIQNGDIIQDVNGTAIMNTSTYQNEALLGNNVRRRRKCEIKIRVASLREQAAMWIW